MTLLSFLVSSTSFSVLFRFMQAEVIYDQPEKDACIIRITTGIIFFLNRLHQGSSKYDFATK
ncbi:hypothetical protein XIS1_460019 [Xenorhabdus innexi]|uniref:Uncharacterized protein n=1 Tax=Xenorhabdus innexi TaxID=290109 RepID=A0A1N6MY46_9GAMM|nr:hypothetical protein XIS1_460019 [Xenorhabdus innexi]